MHQRLGVATSLITILCLFTACGTTTTSIRNDEKEDPYAEYVWPPPPDEARIKLTDIIHGRIDVVAGSRFSRSLFGASPHSPYDWLKKPFAVAFDTRGRILVTDSTLGALIRFDEDGKRMDVFGVTGGLRLKTPLGLGLGPDDTIYVADAGIAKVLAFDEDGNLKGIFGREGELVNPTDAAVSPDGEQLFVTDSKAQQIVVFDIESTAKASAFGTRGEGQGEFNYPSSLAFSSSGRLIVVDQLNARVLVLDREGEYIEEFGSRGVNFGSFVRPKDVAVDEHGLIYVTDGAFNNVQIFRDDLALLTFVGDGGVNPGQFRIASGISVYGNRFAVADQLNRRVQVFEFVSSRVGDSPQ
ncbi:MAG: hypothetical protein GY906_26995 [bacterium]|nr:hypothetical protein [bacterium]